MPAARGEPTLADLRDRYLETHGNGTLEHHTLRGIRRHFRHLAGCSATASRSANSSLADLQGYVDKRAKAKGRRGLLPGHDQEGDRHAPHRLELGRADEDRLGPLPLRRPALSRNPTRSRRSRRGREIERQLPGLPTAKADELWEAST